MSILQIHEKMVAFEEENELLQTELANKIKDG